MARFAECDVLFKESFVGMEAIQTCRFHTTSLW
jgi:hypothetical protein